MNITPIQAKPQTQVLTLVITKHTPWLLEARVKVMAGITSQQKGELSNVAQYQCHNCSIVEEPRGL